jgi:predicted N-acyltransferase
VTDYRTRILRDLDEVHAPAWDGLVRASTGADVPAFLRHDFLAALERTGCVGPGTGWQPEHLCLYDGERLVAAAPLYRKRHSWGEYVFDWAWADAYERHGLRYYPKLVCAIPFTPVAGPRLLAPDRPTREALAAALVAHARSARVSSLHVLFPGAADAEALQARQLSMRRGVQFHWRNAGYRDFEDFLAGLAQPKRKKIRAERRKVREAGVSFLRLTGEEIGAAQLDFFVRCYEATYAAHGSTPYLGRGFFGEIARTMGDRLILVLALREGRPIASSLLVRDRDRLYGRYWGAVEHVPCLHFETAYYQAIEAAIELGVQAIEGGAQGEHKMARGFLAEQTCSLHWLAEPAFADAVDRFLEREGQAIDGYMDELTERSPFRAQAQPAPPAASAGSTA